MTVKGMTNFADSHLAGQQHSVEKLRCADDTKYFMSSQVRVLGDDQQLVTLRPSARQAELVEYVETLMLNGQGGDIIKKRQTGVTVHVLAIMLHRWLFHVDFKGCAIADRMARVNGSGGSVKNSMLGVLTTMVENLSSDLRPFGFNTQQVLRQSMMVNPETGAVIYGVAATDASRGTQGGFDLCFVDDWDVLRNKQNIHMHMHSAKTLIRSINDSELQPNVFNIDGWKKGA